MTPPPVTPRRPVDVLGIVAVALAALLLAPTLVIFLIGLIPSMNAIWWYVILLMPLLAVAGAVVLVLAVIGIVVAVRRRGRMVWSIVAVVLGILMLFPVAYVWVRSLS